MTVGWKVTYGVGLIQDCPFSPERRAIVEREAEQDRRRTAFAAELRSDHELKRVAELERLGYQPRTRAQLFEQVTRAMDHQDRVDAKNEERTRSAREEAVGERHAQRVAQLQAELAVQKDRTLWALHDANTLGAAYFEARHGRSAGYPDTLPMHYRVRNYWE